MSTVIAPYLIGPAIQEKRWARNGLTVDAGLQTGLANVANQIARWRTKEVFRWHGAMGFTPAGLDALAPSSTLVTGRDRWRFAFHSGPFAKEIAVTFLCCIQDAATTGKTTDPYSRLRILDAGGSTVGDGTFHFGSGPGAIDTPDNFATGNAYIPISPDRAYTGVISDFDGARIVAAVVYERSLDPDTSNGYIPANYAAGMNIYDTDRSEPMLLAADMWKKGGAHLLNWSVDDQSSPIAISTTTDTNIVDTTSTTVSSSTPGYIIDLTHSDRLSETSGIPCLLAAYGKYVITPPVSGGTLKIKDSSGTTLATVTGFTSTAGWQTTTFNLPAASDRYDFQFASSSGTGTFSLYAVSMFQLG